MGSGVVGLRGWDQKKKNNNVPIINAKMFVYIFNLQLLNKTVKNVWYIHININVYINKIHVWYVALIKSNLQIILLVYDKEKGEKVSD